MEATLYPHAAAAKCAEYIVSQLQPYCHRIHIAGSIRRMRPQVKDIEIVCLPQREFVQKGLFPDDGEWLITRDFSQALASITASTVKGNVSGRYMQVITTSTICPGIKLDLFLPASEDYFRQLIIRTGSSDYVHHIIAAAWKRKGWCGVKSKGLRRIDQCISSTAADGTVTYTENHFLEMELPPRWQSEEEVFDWLGVAYTQPAYREFKPVLNTHQ